MITKHKETNRFVEWTQKQLIHDTSHTGVIASQWDGKTVR